MGDVCKMRNLAGRLIAGGGFVIFLPGPGTENEVIILFRTSAALAVRVSVGADLSIIRHPALVRQIVPGPAGIES